MTARSPDRALLRRSKLEDFKAWLDIRGIPHRPTMADYQVLQVYDHPTGDWVPVYKKASAPEYYTVQGRMVELVQRYIKERKALV